MEYTRGKRLVLCVLACAGLGAVALARAPRPQMRLFASFGETVNVPDGLTQDAKGNIYLAAPNLRDSAYPGCIMKRCAATGKWRMFVAGLLSPKTLKARPMGLEWCPDDGNLYYCDNQYFDSTDYASRIMRVVIDPASGEAVRIETVVDGIKLANAIRFYKGELFFTDTFFDLKRPGGEGLGGVYRVPLAACSSKTCSLLPKERYREDPYFVAATHTLPLPGRGGDNSGADGLAITPEGHLYFGTFGSGRLYACKRRADGTYANAACLLDDPSRLTCCDGMCYDAAKNRLLIADSACNAIRTWDIAAGTLGTLWQNGDTDGADGLLDQPCEPMVWRAPDGTRKLVVANFDKSFPGLVNRRDDAHHTLSVLDLD